MIAIRRIDTAPGLAFDVATAGDPAAPLVLLLHGFCVSRHLWDAQLPALAAAGLLAWAPNQRGYSPGARPDPADVAQYDIERLIGDAMDLGALAGYGVRRFHLVGHDWGASLAWEIAGRYPERLASLSVFSRPHPAAFRRAMQQDPEQPHRSRHHKEFLDPAAGPRLLAEDARWVRTRLAANGVPAAAIAAHLSVLGNPSAMEAALAWYRARGSAHRPVGPIGVPTLFVWGDADDTVGRMAAEGTADFIAAPYRFEALPGVGHYAPNQLPDRVSALLLEHLAHHRG